MTEQGQRGAATQAESTEAGGRLNPGQPDLRQRMIREEVEAALRLAVVETVERIRRELEGLSEPYARLCRWLEEHFPAPRARLKKIKEATRFGRRKFPGKKMLGAFLAGHRAWAVRRAVETGDRSRAEGDPSDGVGDFRPRGASPVARGRVRRADRRRGVAARRLSPRSPAGDLRASRPGAAGGAPRRRCEPPRISTESCPAST